MIVSQVYDKLKEYIDLKLSNLETALTTLFQTYKTKEVGSNIEAVKTVSNDLTNINTVSTNINYIDIVSSNINYVNTVSDNIDIVKSVSNITDAVLTTSANVNYIVNVSDNIQYVKNINPITDNIVYVSNNMVDVQKASLAVDNIETATFDATLNSNQELEVSYNIDTFVNNMYIDNNENLIIEFK